MGSTGGEDLIPASPGWDPQNSTGDVDIRDNNKDKRLNWAEALDGVGTGSKNAARSCSGVGRGIRGKIIQALSIYRDRPRLNANTKWIIIIHGREGEAY